MFGITPENVEMWLALQAAQASTATVIIGERERCGGCGKFLPKDLTNESYLMIGLAKIHMREKCITSFVTKLRKQHPDWDWPMKDDEDA